MSDSAVTFLSDFRHLSEPYDRLAAVLLGPAAAWLYELPGAVVLPAAPDGDCANNVARCKMAVGTGRLRSLVAVSAGPPRSSEQLVIVPLCWKPARFGRLLPELDADVELSPAGEASFGCRLAVSGRYRTPLAPVGPVADRLAVRFLAEASIRHFLDDLATALRQEAERGGKDPLAPA